jgi:hypothetical protein
MRHLQYFLIACLLIILSMTCFLTCGDDSQEIKTTLKIMLPGEVSMDMIHIPAGSFQMKTKNRFIR